MVGPDVADRLGRLERSSADSVGLFNSVLATERRPRAAIKV
jgi:hypothetical protein